MSRKPARRFLAPGARTGGGHGYVTQPLRPLQEGDPPELAQTVGEATRMCDEPEAVGPAVVNAQTDLARTYDRLRYTAEVQQAQQARRQLTIEQRMVDAQRRAKQRHADISGELHLIAKMLERARNGGRKDPPAAFRRLERIEARLDYRHDLEPPETPA